VHEIKSTIQIAPSLAGEGWGEEKKSAIYLPLIPTFSLKGEGACTAYWQY
jgi:hypothetical protein